LTLKRGKGLPRPEKNEKTTTRLPKAGLPGKAAARKFGGGRSFFRSGGKLRNGGG